LDLEKNLKKRSCKLEPTMNKKLMYLEISKSKV
jgi:hypothetical protein